MASPAVSSVATQQPQGRTEGSRFKYALAVPLGGCAFGAYNYPEISSFYKRYDVKQTTITFINKNYLKKLSYGLLEVKVLSAKDLRASDYFGEPEPFAVLCLEMRSLGARTRAVEARPKSVSRNPMWDAAAPALQVPIRDPATDVFTIQMYDKDPHQNEDIGSATLKLDKVVAGGDAVTLELPLTGKGARPGSTVTVRCRLRPMGQVSLEELAQITSSTAVARTAADSTTGQQCAVEALELLTQQAKITAAPAAATKIANATTTPAPGAAKAAPAPPAPSWRELCAAVGGDAAEEFSEVAYIECLQTDTQAWVFAHVGRQQLVLAYRGTEKMQDWSTNMQAVPVRPNQLLPVRPRPALPGLKREEIMVHRGFLGGYESVRSVVLPFVDWVSTLPGPSGSPPRWQMLVAGHSLGGALATLSAYDLAARKWDQEAQPGGCRLASVTLYTWGCPRVGNKAFTFDFNDLLPDAWRVSNGNDIVCCVPFSMWEYCHGGVRVFLGANGAFEFDTSEASSNLWGVVWSGQAVDDHLEPSYRNTMYKGVKAMLQATAPRAKL